MQASGFDMRHIHQVGGHHSAVTGETGDVRA